MAWGCLIVLIAIAVSNTYAADGFTPGCSFIGGQCMYTVQLGHAGQCDAVNQPSSGSGSNQCCEDVKNDVTNMKTDINTLKSQVQALMSSLNQATTDLEAAHTSLNKTEKERDALVVHLKEMERELNATNEQLARVVSQAASEIQNLRADLTNATINLSMCKTALGVSTGQVTPPTASGDASLYYCGFEDISKCGFTALKGGINWGLMTKGSSSYTGPKADHSFGSFEYGKYLGLDAVKAASATTSSTSREASMESPMYDPANAYCILFWYSLIGEDVEDLKVNIRIGGGTGYPVYTVSSNQHVNWKLAQIDLDSEYTSHPFKIDFVGTSKAYKRGSYSGSHYQYHYTNEKSDIGIDDLYVYNTSCLNIPKCPAGSHKNTINNVTSCYTFHASPMSWSVAYGVCRQEGPWSALVSLESEDEHNFLAGLIKSDPSLSVIGQNGFYTSGNDINKEHSFAWSNTGTPDPISYSRWHTGQPNNVGGHQDCLLLEYPNDNYNWGDVECDTHHPFICEVSYTE